MVSIVKIIEALVLTAYTSRSAHRESLVPRDDYSYWIEQFRNCYFVLVGLKQAFVLSVSRPGRSHTFPSRAMDIKRANRTD